MEGRARYFQNTCHSPTSADTFSFLPPKRHEVYVLKMESQENNFETEPYPIIFMPKNLAMFLADCEMLDDVFIHLNITAPISYGNETTIYNGYCNMKVLDRSVFDVRYASPNSYPITENMPVILAENNQIVIPTNNESQVRIDPTWNPYVYNHSDPPPVDTSTNIETTENHVPMEQQITYTTQNVYSCNETIRYPPANSGPKIVNLREDEEFYCGVYAPQISEQTDKIDTRAHDEMTNEMGARAHDEKTNEKDDRAHDEKNFVGLQTDNGALKQLMSTDLQSVSRPQKTILFLGHDSLSGQTVQNITINDPSVECVGAGEVDNEVTIDDNDITNNPRAKKYQCNKCKQIFDQLSAFKLHMVSSHRRSFSGNLKYMCSDCGKTLKSQEKFERHCLGHGDPERECNKCYKVFASKFTLRNHLKIHSRKFPCKFCSRSFATMEELHKHSLKSHYNLTCKSCLFVCQTEQTSELEEHQKLHSSLSEPSIRSREPDFAAGEFEKFEDKPQDQDSEKLGEEGEHLQSPDAVIAKVISNELFQTNSQRNKKYLKYNKSCELCHKKFDRISDLKRHLIEHVTRSTLARNPVNIHGILNIRCEICDEKVFTKIDRYKAHLREHAQLTLYKCTLCDKSFSDSSNFSKHKKVHDTTYFQCDLCQRKFNTKKMLIQHMEYHNKNVPIKCQICDKVFHFESMLKKHLRCSHTRQTTSKFRCRFCHQYFGSLKEKWDHEWVNHNVRKEIMDCLICGSRFRKYSELKRHCRDEHNTLIPPAKRLLRRKLNNKKVIDENQ